MTSATSAAAILAKTEAAGVMSGRAAIRNPWIFKQIRQRSSDQPVSIITLAEVRDYMTVCIELQQR